MAGRVVGMVAVVAAEIVVTEQNQESAAHTEVVAVAKNFALVVVRYPY